jgi:hypothetical protein
LNPTLHHLNIRVTRRESVASEERSRWNNKRTDQLAAKPHSIPAPTSQPLLVLLSKMVTEAPVVALVMVTLLLPTQPPRRAARNRFGSGD